MSLPITGNKQPSRPATHTPLDFERLFRLASDLEDELGNLGDDRLTPALVEQIADELGVRESHLYAAAATAGTIACDESDPKRFEVCVGNCQGWGAIELLERLLAVASQRRHDGVPSFGIVAKQCLDQCASAPVVLIQTPEGKAGLLRANLSDLDRAIADLEE